MLRPSASSSHDLLKTFITLESRENTKESNKLTRAILVGIALAGALYVDYIWSISEDRRPRC